MIRSTLLGLLALAVLAVFVVLAGTADAGGTRSFRQTSAGDFEEGEATASMILPTGDVVPGMKTARIPVDAAFVWSAALSPDGRTAYFGTGDQGRIYAVPISSVGGVDSPGRKLVELDAAWITSLAVQADGTLLAGSTPGGRVFHVDPRRGTSRAFAKIPAEHVWALAHDQRTKVTYAAGGSPGKVFALDAQGKVRLLWDAGDKHVVSLFQAGGGVLLAGTADDAILYRVRPDGHAEALHDFEADEVRAIARVGRATYLAVNDFERSALPPPSALSTAKGTGIAASPTGAPASIGGPARGGGERARGAVYRLDDDGRIEQVFSASDGYLTGLLTGAAGELYLTHGTQGKLYKLAPDRTSSLAADLPERQALVMVRTPDGFLVGAGDVGGVYRVRPATGDEASYLSKILDAEVPARWGQLRWTGGAGLVFETRSGNTAKPDRSWTAWRKLGGPAHAGEQGEGKVSSESSRYLQYRVAMPGKSSVLREVNVYYLPQNQRARITDVTLGEESKTKSPTSTPAAASRERQHSTILRLRWKVENLDDDELIHRLWFRPESESVWRLLGGPEPLTKAEFDWNTESVPDGRYVIRVWASDERVTPRDRALDSTLDSAPFLVDNSRPEVTDLQARGATITGRVRDQVSPIAEVEYAIDSQDWRPTSPADGILDQRSEGFSIALPALTPGPHVVNVRAFDGADNVGSARLVIQGSR